MLPIKTSAQIFLLLLFTFHCAQNINAQQQNIWEIGDPVFLPGTGGSFDEVAVKDPSIVFFENEWHIFYTARSKNEYTTGYVSAKNLTEIESAPRYELKQIRGKARYGCAPQIFYFEPQAKWYLIFQTTDSNYQPAFSTNVTISNPDMWSESQPLLQKDKKEKWIDFWIIADDSKVYLFYTEAHSGVVVRSTNLKDFPNGWSAGKKVFDNVHEAVHVYKVKNKQEFHMFYEQNHEGIRSFGISTACNLNEPWENFSDEYASGNQLKFVGANSVWTEMVSHGEVIRSGYNQKMEYEPENCKWIIQGIMKNQLNEDYPTLPWKLGIMNLRP
jgi:hypothetical protein